jgi:hypothetical protein
VLAGRDMVVAGAGEATAPCLLGEGRSILPSPFEVMWNSLAESPIMSCNVDSGPSWAEPMMMVSKPSRMGERLRTPKWSAMHLIHAKQMVSSSEKPPHNRRSPLAATASADDETIGMPRGKARCKSPFLACQLSVFFALGRTGWLGLHVPVLRWSCEL